MVWINPLDLERILILELSGDELVFIFLAFLVISIMAARFKMTGGVFLTVFVMFLILMLSTYILGTFLQGLLIVILFGVIFVIARAIGKGFGG